MTEQRTFPPMPEIGCPEGYYAKGIHRAEERGDTHAREAYKVGQYITLALDPHLTWPEKVKYFRHAVKRHCAPPPFPDEDVWMFYQNLADLVRSYAGQEALRLASQEDDLYAARVTMGQDRDTIADEAEEFFAQLCPPGKDRPEWFNEADYDQLCVLRDQWI